MKMPVYEVEVLKQTLSDGRKAIRILDSDKEILDEFNANPDKFITISKYFKYGVMDKTYEQFKNKEISESELIDYCRSSMYAAMSAFVSNNQRELKCIIVFVIENDGIRLEMHLYQSPQRSYLNSNGMMHLLFCTMKNVVFDEVDKAKVINAIGKRYLEDKKELEKHASKYSIVERI